MEAAFFSGAFYYLSVYYTRKQIALRTAILYSDSQLGNAFGTLFAIGIIKVDGCSGLECWCWLFLIQGVLTVGLALVFACYIRDSPRKIIGMYPQQLDWL